jgi:hypothetical protein
MLTTEKTIKILPHVVRIYKKVDLKSYQIKINKENKGKSVDVEAEGLALIMYVAENVDKAQNEVYNVFSILNDVSVKEVKELPITDVLEPLFELMKDEKAMGFFKLAMK